MWFSKATTHSTDAAVGHGEQWPDGQQDVFWSIKGSVGRKAAFPLPLWACD